MNVDIFLAKNSLKWSIFVLQRIKMFSFTIEIILQRIWIIKNPKDKCLVNLKGGGATHSNQAAEIFDELP